MVLQSIKQFIKYILSWSPIPLTKNQLYDRQAVQVMRLILKPSSNCIDVGCHRGEILDMMLQYAPQGHHFGFEPIPALYELLRDKYSNCPNVNIHDMALSDERGVSSFNLVQTNPAYSGFRKRDYDREEEQDTTIEVKTERLDQIIPGDIRIELIKIDVEGAELQVLEGGENLIERDKPVIIFEHGLGASDHYGTRPENIFEYFEDKDMLVSTMSRYLNKKPPLDLKEFKKQYYRSINYYFIAYPR